MLRFLTDHLREQQQEEFDTSVRKAFTAYRESWPEHRRLLLDRYPGRRRDSLTVYDGMIGMTENMFINTKNRSHTITADVEIPAGGANGVILSQAGRFGGWSLYVKNGKPMYTYNYLGLSASQVASSTTLPEGK